MDAKNQALFGLNLFSWATFAAALNDVSIVASCIAAVCGAIIGIHAVWRLWKHRKEHKNG